MLFVGPLLREAFIAEIIDEDRYGPAMVSVDAPESWRYFFDENVDPKAYSISSDGLLMAVDATDWTKVIEFSTDGWATTASLPASGQVLACPDSINRLVYEHKQWLVHSPTGEAIGRIDSSHSPIACPMAP